VQGIPGVSKGTNTIIFIKRGKIPANHHCDATYVHVCVNYRPEKEDPNHTQLTVGGNLIHVLGNVSMPTIVMVTVKLHLISVISTKGAHYCTINLKDFYLNTPMARPKYMHMKLKDIPPKFFKIYDLKKIAAPDGTIYVKIQKGMYGLPQAGILAQNLLEEQLNTSEAAPCPLQPCYFDKWDIFAHTLDCQDGMGFPVCILNNFLPIFPISCHLLMSE
jgi:hypothetical protein